MGVSGVIRDTRCMNSFYGSNLTDSTFEGALAMGVDFTLANLTRVNFTDTDLRGANFAQANLAGANLTRANLFGVNLEGANLEGVIWCDTVLPDGTITSVSPTGS